VSPAKGATKVAIGRPESEAPAVSFELGERESAMSQAVHASLMTNAH
jgi:hypothetical protein